MHIMFWMYICWKKFSAMACWCSVLCVQFVPMPECCSYFVNKENFGSGVEANSDGGSHSSIHTWDTQVAAFCNDQGLIYMKYETKSMSEIS